VDNSLQRRAGALACRRQELSSANSHELAYAEKVAGAVYVLKKHNQLIVFFK
jgi:hypothetical protein